MLDLQHLGSFYELKWFDGRTLHLKKPSEGKIREIAAFAEQETNTQDNIDMMKTFVRDLIKDNSDGIEFTDEELNKELDGVVCAIILKDYFETIQERLGE